MSANAVCKGSYLFESACGNCTRCTEELRRLKKDHSIRKAVSDQDLNIWEAAAEDLQHLEIIRLARIGLCVERHSVAIEDALVLAIGELSVAKISRFERALDDLQKVKK